LTPAELYKLCKKQKELGLTRLPLAMAVPKSLRNRRMQKKVRTPFGLCDWGGTGDPDKIVIWADVDRVLKTITKTAFEVIE
jgi:hypothetical protein